MSSVLSTETDSSVTDSASTPSTPSTTFTDTEPSSTRPTPTTRTGGFNGGGGGGGNGNGIGSSAATSLYLYTFLATLVLLLLISGAIVARSIRLRMRARRALEESIRNGTYIPPVSGVNARDAPKPKFHDAHIDDKDASSLIDEKHSRWGNLVPVTAAFVLSKTFRPLPQPATSAPPRTSGSLGTRLRNLNPFRAVQVQDIIDELASRDPRSRLTSQQPPQPSQGELASVAFGSPPTNDDNSDQQVLGRPSTVRVAVLVAMPDPARPTSGHTSDDTSSSSSTKGKTPASGSAMASDDEGDMPYVEFGVAEVPFASTASPRSEFSSNPSTPPSSPPRAS